MKYIGKKLNMTQAFDGNIAEPVTILDLSGFRIQESKKESKYLAYGSKSKPGKPETGIFGENNVPEYYILTKDSEEGEVFSDLNQGVKVNIRSISKGKGFAGVMRMWNFKGGKRTRGQSDRERHGGSIGTRIIPGRVYKGKRMPRHKGNEYVTIQNLKVVKFDLETKLLMLKGSVPGAYNSFIELTVIK